MSELVPSYQTIPDLPPQAADGGWLAPLIHGLDNPKPDSAKSADNPPQPIPMYSNIGAAMLRQRVTVGGLVWMLVHHHTNRLGGRQIVAECDIVDLLVSSGIYKCGRRWRDIRHLGQGVFWERLPDSRYLVYGVARVAENLGLSNVGKRVAIMPDCVRPKRFKSALHAAFLTANTDRPISRETIEELTGAARSTQWRRDRESSVEASNNISIMGAWTPDNVQNAHYQHSKQHSTPIFKFVDFMGLHGQPMGEHIAKNLPNTYTTNMQMLPSGRRKRVNRKLRTRVFTRGAAIVNSNTVEQIFFDSPVKVMGGGLYQSAVTSTGGTAFWYSM